ncbi:MAG: serine protease [Verrucomicrobiales bacterium]|nr:serine protease [Verrucomicrobiales bacterium]
MIISVRCFLVGALALGCFVSCTTVEPLPVTDAVRDASFVPFKGVTVGSELLSRHVQKRTAFLLSGVDLPEVTNADETSVRGAGDSSGAVYYGSAAAIDRRGYFVTAAHCVEDNPDKLRLTFLNDGAISVRQARVVYMGNPSTDNSDFAIVHVPMILSDVFDWADQFGMEDPVMCSGAEQAGDGSRKHFKMVMSGGSIKALENRVDSGNAYEIIRHSAPIYHGNSGGPLVDLQGRLVGVNFSATFSGGFMKKPSMKYSSAIRPDVKWVQRIIAKDLESQNW